MKSIVASLLVLALVLTSAGVLLRTTSRWLAQLSSAIAACEANIHNMTMRMGSLDFHKFIIEIEVRDLAQLTVALRQIRSLIG